MEDIVARALRRQGGATGRERDEVGSPPRHLEARIRYPQPLSRRLDSGGGGAVTAFKYGPVRSGSRVVVVALAGSVRIHRADALRVCALVVGPHVVRRGVLGVVDDRLQRHAL